MVPGGNWPELCETDMTAGHPLSFPAWVTEWHCYYQVAFARVNTTRGWFSAQWDFRRVVVTPAAEEKKDWWLGALQGADMQTLHDAANTSSAEVQPFEHLSRSQNLLMQMLSVYLRYLVVTLNVRYRTFICLNSILFSCCLSS